MIKSKIATVALCVGLISTSVMAKGGHHNNQGNSNNTSYVENVVNTSVFSELSDQQKDDIIFMYQDEKMARDVYTVLGELWDSNVFVNIQKAEQKHMDSVKTLLDKYSLPIPVIEDEIGVFENSTIQAMYDQLVEQGKESLEEAIRVGILIEETDIADLEARLTDTPEDIKAVYENLLHGSYNHLNAFNRVLDTTQTTTTQRGGKQGSQGRHGRQ